MCLSLSLLHPAVLAQQVGNIIVSGADGQAGGRTALKVGGVHVRTGLEQRLDHGAMPALRGQVQRRATGVVSDVGVCLRLKQHQNDIRVATLGGQVKRRAAELILDVCGNSFGQELPPPPEGCPNPRFDGASGRHSRPPGMRIRG